jgi:hypothetical protein
MLQNPKHPTGSHPKHAAEALLPSQGPRCAAALPACCGGASSPSRLWGLAWGAAPRQARNPDRSRCQSLHGGTAWCCKKKHSLLTLLQTCCQSLCRLSPAAKPCHALPRAEPLRGMHQHSWRARSTVGWDARRQLAGSPGPFPLPSCAARTSNMGTCQPGEGTPACWGGRSGPPAIPQVLCILSPAIPLQSPCNPPAIPLQSLRCSAFCPLQSPCNPSGALHSVPFPPFPRLPPVGRPPRHAQSCPVMPASPAEQGSLSPRYTVSMAGAEPLPPSRRP